MTSQISRNETLCFVHIPKTAGLTLRIILDSRFRWNDICPADDYSTLAAFSKDDIGEYRLVRGHFWQNVGECMSSQPLLMTVLRDPVERTLSQYEYTRREPANGPLYDLVRNMTIEEYLRDEFLRECFVRDVQTRFIAPVSQPVDPNEFAPLVHLGIEQAKSNLLKFRFVGITERFDDTVRLLAHTLGWRPINAFLTRNSARGRVARSQLPRHVVEDILSLNENDAKLYEFAMELFDQRYTAMVDDLLDDEFHRHSAAVALPKDTVRVEFDQVPNGDGWYPAELSEAGEFFRWTGPTTTAFLDLPVSPGRDMRIRFKVVDRITVEVLESLSVRVNDTLINVTPESSASIEVVFAGVIPASALRADWPHARVSFQLSQTQTPPDSGDGPNCDDRHLGVALAWIEITPLDCSVAADVAPVYRH